MTSRPPGKRDLILKCEARGRVNEASDGEVYALVYTGKRRLFRGSGETPCVHLVLVLNVWSRPPAGGRLVCSNSNTWAYLVAQLKASACNARDPGSIPGSGRSPGGGNGNPLQYS